MTRGMFSIGLAALIFGSAGLFINTLDIPVLAKAGYRLFVPVVVIAFLRSHLLINIFRRPNKILLVASVLTLLRISLWAFGFSYAPISQAVVILFTWPLMLTILSCIFLGERLQRRSILLLLFAFAGIVVFSSASEVGAQSSQRVGLAAMFCVAVLVAIVMTLFKKELKRHSAQEVLLYDNFFGAIVFTPVLLWYLPSMSLGESFYALFYGFFIGFVGWIFLYYGLSRTKASTASVLCYLEVVSAALLGVVFLNELLSFQMVLGASMILVAAFYIRDS